MWWALSGVFSLEVSGERSLHEFADACMDEWKRLCSHAHTEDRVTSSLEETGLLARMKGAVCREVVKPSVEMGGVEKTVFDAVANSSLLVQLKNIVYKELCSLLEQETDPVGVPAYVQKEPVAFIRLSQEKWEGKLKQAINKLCIDFRAPLARERPHAERELLKKKWNSLGADYPELCKYHPIFGPKDFMAVIKQVADPNYIPLLYPPVVEGEVPAGSSRDPAGGVMQACINVESLYKLREKFKCLHPSQVQMESASPDYLEKSNRVVKNGLWSLAKELCKTGCVITHRRDLWCRTLAVDTSQSEHAFCFEDLKSEVFKYVLVFEKLIINDVKKTAANDDNYFVFEDIMLQVLLCFLHDSSLIQHYDHLSPTPFAAYFKGQENISETVYPPNGVVPFHGFSLYMAPLCFLFDRPDHLYALFKQMYLRFFVHLHSLSSHPQGILSLCCQFESLLQCREPELFKHLNHIKAHPLPLAFFWLMSAFSGYLDSREVLLLWDRVIGFNSLTIVAVMAVAIFEFRAANLFKATNQSEAEDVLSDLRCVKVLPLLQQTLFL